jgi:hypothetical protein
MLRGLTVAQVVRLENNVTCCAQRNGEALRKVVQWAKAEWKFSGVLCCGKVGEPRMKSQCDRISKSAGSV